MFNFFKILFIGFCLILAGTHSIAAELKIMSWGVTDISKSPSFVNEIRLGCPPDPQYCVNKLRAYNNKKIRKAALAIDWKSLSFGELTKHINIYQELVKQNSGFDIELGIDDFGSFVKKYGKEKTAEIIFLLQSRKSIKNQPYSVGITLYEDEVDKITKDLSSLPSIAAGVDRIVLYLHYRANHSAIDKHLQAIRHFSANSEIYLGIYHYDRSDYISCSPGNPKKCSEQQDVDLFNQALKTQVSRLIAKKIDGLELYPGNFGSESAWAGWKNPRICSPDRIMSCISNTKTMSDIVTRQLSNPSLGR
jgi:hypothetical protein